MIKKWKLPKEIRRMSFDEMVLKIERTLRENDFTFHKEYDDQLTAAKGDSLFFIRIIHGRPASITFVSAILFAIESNNLDTLLHNKFPVIIHRLGVESAAEDLAERCHVNLIHITEDLAGLLSQL